MISKKKVNTAPAAYYGHRRQPHHLSLIKNLCYTHFVWRSCLCHGRDRNEKMRWRALFRRPYTPALMRSLVLPFTNDNEHQAEHFVILMTFLWRPHPVAHIFLSTSCYSTVSEMYVSIIGEHRDLLMPSRLGYVCTLAHSSTLPDFPIFRLLILKRYITHGLW